MFVTHYRTGSWTEMHVIGLGPCVRVT